MNTNKYKINSKIYKIVTIIYTMILYKFGNLNHSISSSDDKERTLGIFNERKFWKMREKENILSGLILIKQTKADNKGPYVSETNKFNWLKRNDHVGPTCRREG